ncbi:MAG: EF2563 family selenium-dependent molybdenum hydroxylase system protein [Firmicutes bacterium]|nr:EF2563 family selenium-dependent molybdenum hydroxylase system protein [Bacillota bacterium]
MEKLRFKKVIIKGAGDLASGVAHRLWQSGFDVLLLELPQPLVVRRSVAFACAVYEGTMCVEGVEARLCRSDKEIAELLSQRIIPVLVDPQGEIIPRFKPDVLVDAVLAKKNTGTALSDAPIVIGLGPGFTAGKDVHAVVETQRGHNLGKVFYSGSAAANTGIPGDISGYSMERLLRAPAGGKFEPVKQIGELVRQGETVANVDGVPVPAGVTGLIRGLLYPGLQVQEGMKIGDIDPRGKEVDYLTISDKARAVAGGVLEAILHFSYLQGQ